VATNPANGLTGPERRSTRIERTIPLTVMGVDAWRGPYTESVSTVNVSAHGCKYESAHQVLNDSLVILELKDGAENGSHSVRGRVKYVKRPAAAGKLFQTAIELEDPGNVWGVTDPPKDWLPFCVPKTVELDTAKPKPFALPRPEPEPVPATMPAERTPSKAREPEPVMSLPPGMSAVAQVMGGFQQQMEKMLSEAAAVAVHDRTRATYEELRARLREEVRLMIAETVRTSVDAAVDRSLKQMKAATLESANTLHTEWSKQLETELKQAREQIQAREREMEEASAALSISALDKLQRAMDASRRDAVDRIIARLKEQSAPLLEQAQKVLGDLSRSTQELTQILSRSLQESTEHISQFHSELEKQFEKTMRERLEAARAEFERAARGVTIEALNDLRGLSQKHEAEVRSRLQKALEPMVEGSLQELREKAAQTSRQFASELEDYSSSHLAFVGSALSDLAKGLGKKPKE
jgi:hypothetical protein